MSFALDLLILATGWAHVLLAPHTKVEESFNLHATHDVLFYGVSPSALSHYDHVTFPGAVPRTFIGSVLLAWISTPVIRAASSFDLVHSKFDLQIILRLTLATLNSLGLILIRRGTSKRFGRPTGAFFALLTCSQFHLPFWMGRTLPNMFALLPVNFATYLLLSRAPSALRPSPNSVKLAFFVLTFTAVVLRAEVALLLGPLVLQSLWSRHVGFGLALKIGVVSGLFSLVVTVLVDSYFWNQWPLWPEFSGIYFNVVQGKSAEWGTSPVHAYVSTHLPKLLLLAFPLAALGALVDSRTRTLLVPSVAFVALISGLGHKEWRFVVYVIPTFNIAAARGLRWMTTRRKGTLFGRSVLLIGIGALLVNLVATGLLTRTSMANYPGGDALSAFNELFNSQQHVHVHISNLAAQTGASLFLHTREPGWTYDKTESLTLRDLGEATNVTHVITEANPAELDDSWAWAKREDVWRSETIVHWKVAKAIESFDRWIILRTLPKSSELKEVVKMAKSPKLWILERK